MKAQLDDAKGPILLDSCAEELENQIQLIKESDFPPSVIEESEDALKKLKSKIAVVDYSNYKL